MLTIEERQEIGMKACTAEFDKEFFENEAISFVSEYSRLVPKKEGLEELVLCGLYVLDAEHETENVRENPIENYPYKAVCVVYENGDVEFWEKVLPEQY